MKRENRKKKFGDFLRRGDPLDHESHLSPEEIANIRRRVLAAVPEKNRRFSLPTPTWAVGSAGVLLVLAALLVWQLPLVPSDAESRPDRTPSSGATVVRDAGPSPDLGRPIRVQGVPSWPGQTKAKATKQQLQVVTPGGTRVVWILDTDFDV